MDSSVILFLMILVSFLTFVTTQAQDPVYLHRNCYGGNTTAKSVFQFNLKKLLSSLSSNDLSNTEFYETRVGEDPADSVYGLFMCRGDVPTSLCQQCVVSATELLDLECSLSKQAVIWYDECTVRYSNKSFFSSVDTRPSVGLLNTGNISNQESFMRLLFLTMNQTADETARPPIGQKKFATSEAKISAFQTLYCLAQCTPDLSPHDCRICLNGVIGDLPWCCEGKRGGRVLYPSCNVRYELYPFYRPTVRPLPVPATNFPDRDSKLTADPIYLYHNCSDSKTFTVDKLFQLSLSTLLAYLSSNATGGKDFYTVDVTFTVYGLFMCRGDVPSNLCGECVVNATHRIASECRLLPEAIIWYSQCLLRYSYRNFFSKMETSPLFSELNITSEDSSPTQEQRFFTFTLSNTLDGLAFAAGGKVEKYVTGRLKLNANQTLYTLAQCTQDLSTEDCVECLADVITTAIPWSGLGSVGGRVLYPSCNIRFELVQFYRDDAPPPTSISSSLPPSGATEKRKGHSRIIILIAVPTIVSVILFSFGYYLVMKKARKSHKTILRENFGQESAVLEPLQFDLAIIQAATNNFSNENKIGKGGFGEVYKGILLDGRQIAVKRLSKCSRQGVNEFKNEVLLIAKLQHRNLVAFIGFCLEEQDKILIYEFVQNKSLDYFLFDSQRHKLLSWFERHNIIGGIAGGMLYLHEQSRLKVIHRDLKPSNILLDENLNPKISEFGLARIVEINQDEGSTNRIVGTHGYMSPEYIMLGQFSEKSDVFSFGVMILEIITGKKPHHVGNGLLNYVWRQWRDQTPLNILDPSVKENYSEIEVIKCTRIGLLCVQPNPEARPTMATVISYLSNYSIELPTPQEPAFFMHHAISTKSLPQESCSSQSINNSTLLSTNEMSNSSFLPR